MAAARCTAKALLSTPPNAQLLESKQGAKCSPNQAYVLQVYCSEQEAWQLHGVAVTQRHIQGCAHLGSLMHPLCHEALGRPTGGNLLNKDDACMRALQAITCARAHVHHVIGLR